MNITAIITATVVVGAVGIFVGLFLGIAGIQFKVQIDEREEAVQSVLPGNNCGGCGYAGCSGLASAIAKGEAPVNACPVGGEGVAKKIAAIMGVEAADATHMVAFVACQGDCDKTKENYEYHGAEDCRMLSFVPDGGPKSCSNGCLGFGTCVKACPFDAIHVVNGVALVDREACRACGKCVAACPKKLISLIPYEAKYAVACSSTEKGPATMKACTVGCIGCGICAKNCPAEAVKVTDFNATIDQEKCTGCGTCAEKCPKKSIVGLGLSRLFSATMTIILCFMMTACGKGDEEDSGKKSEKPLYKQGMEIVELIDEKVHSDAYLNLIATGTIAESDFIAEMKETDYAKPDEIYEIVFPEDTLEELWKSELTEDMEDMPKLLKKEMEGRLLGGFVNLINGKNGALALACSGVLTSNVLFVDEDAKEQNIMYVYCYENAYPVAVTFTYGKNGAVMASGAPCFFKIEFGDEDEVKESLFLDMYDEADIKIKRIKQ